MPGWNLKEGAIKQSRVSDDEYWSLFCFVFSDACRKTNTYKFGLIKSICDQIFSVSSDTDYFLSYECIFSKFTENYWNLVNKYKLKQMLPNGKSEYSKIERIITYAVKEYEIPETILFQSLDSSIRTRIIKEVSRECRNYVVGALYNDFNGLLYSFNLNGTGIFLSEGACEFIAKFKTEIERLNYYSWARFLEMINSDDVLNRVLEKLDLSTPQRKDLSIYREILYKEFQEETCFYCGKKLKKEIHVDHFIPWSYVKSDNLWNFVLACPDCNHRKGNKLTQSSYVPIVEARNCKLQHIKPITATNEFVLREMSGYYSGLLARIWKYASMSGFEETTNL